MELPQYEKEKLLNAILNIDTGLIYLQSHVQGPPASFKKLEDAITRTGRHDLNEQLNEILNDYQDALRDNIKDLREHMKTVCEVTDAIRDGVFG